MHGSLATGHELWIRQTMECVQIRVQTLESGQDQIVDKLISCQSVLDCSVLILKSSSCLNGSWSENFFWRASRPAGRMNWIAFAGLVKGKRQTGRLSACPIHAFASPSHVHKASTVWLCVDDADSA
jgi:hypothetical protein